MTRGQPQKVGSKLRHHPNIKTPRCVCSTEGCSTEGCTSMNLTCISSVYPACPHRHFTEPQMSNPCSPCQSLASFSYRSIKKTGEPDLFKFPSLGTGTPPGPTLTPLLAQSLLSLVGPGQGLPPGLVLGLGPPHLPTPERERGIVQLIL